MMKKILAGVGAGTLLASQLAFAQSVDAREAPADTMGSVRAPTYADRNIVSDGQINAVQGPTQSATGPMEVQVPVAALERLAGKYTAPDNAQIVVTRAGNRLEANLAGLSLEFAPSGPNDFFVEGGPLTLSFALGEAGQAHGLVVRENGIVIMQASASR